MAIVPNSEFTGSLDGFRFQVHILHLLKLCSPGPGKQQHSRIGEQSTDTCVLGPRNTTLPVGGYQNSSGCRLLPVFSITEC